MLRRGMFGGRLDFIYILFFFNYARKVSFVCFLSFIAILSQEFIINKTYF